MDSKIKKVESLVPINPEYIDSIIGLVSIKEASNIEKRNIRQNAMKSINMLEEKMGKSKIEDKTILEDAFKKYRTRIEEAISSDFVPEIDKALEKYGYKKKPLFSFFLFFFVSVFLRVSISTLHRG